MDLKTLLVVLPTDAPLSSEIEVACELGRAFAATLHGLCLYAEPAASPAESFACGAAAIRSVIDHIEERIAATVAPVRSTFQRAVATAGLTGDWTACEERDAVDYFTNAKTYDLAILPRPAGAGVAYRMTEDLLLRLGLPCLLVPEEREGSLRRAVVGCDGSEESRRSLEAALPLVKRADAVRVVTIERRSGSPSSHVATVAAELSGMGIDCDARHYERGSVDDAVLIERSCQDFGAGLLVIGAYSHSRIGEAIWGGVTRHMINHAPIATFLAH